MPAKPRRLATRATGVAAAEARLRAHALAKPGATEHFPWGERAIKVNGKVFLFMSAGDRELSLSTKLPVSAPVALLLPFASPTGYGLGKAGWVSARFEPGEPPPVDMLCDWIDESYQAVAPSKLAALARQSDAGAATPAPARKPAAEPATARKPTAAKQTAARKPTAAAKPRPTHKPAAANPSTPRRPATAKSPAPR